MSSSLSTSTDTAVVANEIVKKRFHFVQHKHPCFKQLFQLAATEQLRKFVNGVESPSRYDTSSRAYALKRPAPIPTEQLLGATNKLGTLPAIFHKMMEVINNPFSSADDAAKVISSDPALSAKLLRLVNSAFYGLPSRVDTISRAVHIVGHGPLMMLTMGTILASSFTGISTNIIDMRSFWMHAFSTGVAAQQLATHIGIKNAENHFVAGLLHDIARLLIFIEAPASAIYMVTESREKNIPLYEVERTILETPHDELAATLLESWNCPETIIEPIAKHHQHPQQNATPKDIILPLANTISIALGYGSSGDFFIMDFPDAIWPTMKLTPDDMTQLVQNLDEPISKMLFAIQPAA